MHVVIIGAGEVGGYLAERLGAEGQDVVVIETDPIRAAQVGAELDIQVLVGSGTSPRILREAGVDRASLLAAVTQNDEVNLVASMLAKQHGVETTVVRVESDELRGDDGTKLLRRVGADVVIDPDAETADEILELVHSTGADEVYPMAKGELVVLGAFVGERAPLAGLTLGEIGAEHEFLVGAIGRGPDTIIPGGDQVLHPGDHVRILSRSAEQTEVLKLLGVESRRARRAMILGGGAVGSRVAEHLEYEGVDVVLIERDPGRARSLANRFRRVTVIEGDITDTDVLLEEGAGDCDVVVAATGEDASNVLACAFAMAEGSPFTVAVLHRLALLPLVRRLGIDAALSPRTASANAVLRSLRGGVTAVATFLEGDAEVDEVEIAFGSPADGSLVSELNLPKDILIGAVIRPGRPAEIVRGGTALQAEDHIVVFGRPSSLTEAKSFFGS